MIVCRARQLRCLLRSPRRKRICMMERKGPPRGRVVNLRAIGGQAEGRGEGTVEGPRQDIIGIGLGYRLVYSEQAEVWTVRGVLRDGTPSRDDIGELSFILIPGDMEPATAVTGFVAPAAPYALAMSEDALWQQLRAMVVQLGYDQDGFYASLGIGGKPRFYEDYRRDR